MKYLRITLSLCVFVLFSFKEGPTAFEFAYPKKKNTTIYMKTDLLGKFSKEWRGSDYYYYNEKDGLICSVLYYKLNKEEKTMLVDAPRAAMNGPELSPAYPFSYFSTSSNLKNLEKNDQSWGEASDAFMYRQNDVEIDGLPYKQKHMYAYTMVDKDLFVNIHISKVNCTKVDSLNMITLLKSFTKTQ